VSEALTEKASFRAMESTDSVSYSAGTNMIRQPSRQDNLQKTQHPTVTGQQTQVFDTSGDKQMKMQTPSEKTVQDAEPEDPYLTKSNQVTDIPVNGSRENDIHEKGNRETDVPLKSNRETDVPLESGLEAVVPVRGSQEAETPVQDSRDTAIPVKDRERLLRARIIGQAFESYILLEDGDEMLLIDQHAAHERIRFEKLKKQFILQEAFGQGLLSPLAVNLSELEMERFHDLSEYLSKLGFEAEVFGTRSILIRAIPYVLDSSFSGQDFLEILEKLSSEAPAISEIIPEETLYMMACKSAIKANRNMSNMEIRGLVEQLADAENPYTCVHGRPVIISMSKKELEKRFKRIV